jgi:hypothetical protein
MTPKDKAQELVDKFIVHTRVYHEVLGWEDYIESAKQCALIAVDEIIEATKHVVDRPDFNGIVFNTYWEQVKAEIQAL